VRMLGNLKNHKILRPRGIYCLCVQDSENTHGDRQDPETPLGDIHLCVEDSENTHGDIQDPEISCDILDVCTRFWEHPPSRF
jgi:hypothetical protein